MPDRDASTVRELEGEEIKIVEGMKE